MPKRREISDVDAVTTGNGLKALLTGSKPKPTQKEQEGSNEQEIREKKEPPKEQDGSKEQEVITAENLEIDVTPDAQDSKDAPGKNTSKVQKPSDSSENDAGFKVKFITWVRLIKNPGVLIWVLAVTLLLSTGFGIALHYTQRAAIQQTEMVAQVQANNAVEREEQLGKNGEALTKVEADPALPGDIPVPIGDRIVIKRDYPVEGSEHVLNCIQSFGERIYKINYSDVYYPTFLNTANGILFAQHDRSEEFQPCHLQILLPEGELKTQIDEAFEDVSEFATTGDSLSFKAMDVKLSGVIREFKDPDGNSWQFISMIESDVPDAYCTQYANSVVSSVGLYYNQRYARPTIIAGDIVDDGLYVDTQGVAVICPRSGVNSLDTYGNNLSVARLNRGDIYGDNPIIFTTSTQDIYGFQEALQMVPSDIEKSYDTIYKSTGNALKLDVQSRATWSNQECYYMEGSIGDKRYVGYVFYNPIHNNFSSLGVFSDSSELGGNCEKLVNAMSEQIDFVGEVLG